MARTKPSVARGDVFLMPLDDGRFGLCRVLAVKKQTQLLVAASPWIGNEAPSSLEPAREILTQRHHAWNGVLAICYVRGPVPKTFRKLGTLVVDDAPVDREAYAGWDYFPMQVLAQWRWDHERAAVLVDDARESADEARETVKSRTTRAAYLEALTLPKLRRKKRFASWEGHVAKARITACRAIFQRTIDRLIALGAKPARRARLAALQTCIVELNELDAKHEFIFTLERENLCEAFDELVHACGLPELENLADRWRAW